MYALNIDIKTPIAKVIANPLTRDVPKAYNIVAVISDETFEAQIDVQAL